MAVVNKFNVNKQQVTLDADIIENMSANDVSYDASTQYDENTVGDKLSELSQQMIYDVTANNDGITFDSLSTLLSSENLSTLIPIAVRCGGMSIRFIQSSYNKYVQYRLMSPSWSTVVANWQGVDDEPTAGSDNLVKSGGVFQIYKKFGEYSGVYSNGSVIFTNTEVSSGNIISVKLILTTVAGSIKVFGTEGNILKSFNIEGQSAGYEKVFEDYVLPNNYAYIKHIPGYSPTVFVNIVVKTMSNAYLSDNVNTLLSEVNTNSTNINNHSDKINTLSTKIESVKDTIFLNKTEVLSLLNKFSTTSNGTLNNFYNNVRVSSVQKASIGSVITTNVDIYRTNLYNENFTVIGQILDIPANVENGHTISSSDVSVKGEIVYYVAFIIKVKNYVDDTKIEIDGVPINIYTLQKHVLEKLASLRTDIVNVNNILENIDIKDVVKNIKIGEIPLENTNNVVVLPEASQHSAGLMSSEDKAKLDGMSGDITIEGSGVYKNANAYGFLPTNDADTNSINLQNCLNGGGTIHIDLPGTYELNHTMFLDDNTELIFGAGVVISKVVYNGIFPRVVFTNRNSLQRSWNKNISIRNLFLQTNGLGVGNSESAQNTYGIRSQIAFFYIKNLVIDGYYSTDNSTSAFNIQICTFENIRLENIYITSAKDGIHLGRGKNFIIRNYKARTKDDVLALNADDYPGSNPESGWIENGQIDNLTILPDDTLVPVSGSDENIIYEPISCAGRILMIGGSWKEWESGMEFQSNGDCVLSDGKLYVTTGGTSDVTSIISTVRPTHSEFTTKTYSDGLQWRLRQNVEPLTTCSVKNITFNNINVLGRFASAKIFLESQEYRRSYYPGSTMANAQDITFSNVNIAATTQKYFIQFFHGVENLKIINSNLKYLLDCLWFIDSKTGSYPEESVVSILLIGNYYDFVGSKNLYKVDGNNFLGRIKICSSMIKDGNSCNKYDPYNRFTVLEEDIFKEFSTV